MAGDTQPIQSNSWSSHPNHVILPNGRQLSSNPTNSQVGSPSPITSPQSPPNNCLPSNSAQFGQTTQPGSTQIGWCTPLQSSGNETEPVVAWFTYVQPGDDAPAAPSNATESSNGTETEEASTSTKKASPSRELGSCIPIDPNGNGTESAPTPGKIGWFTPIPKPDEANSTDSEPEELNTPGGNVTLGWCTPLLDNADAAMAQLGECRPYEHASAESSDSSSTTTTAKPDTKKDGVAKKELLGWFTPLKIDPAAKGSVIAYFIPVVASAPPPKEPVGKDTKAAGEGGDETSPAPPA